MAVVTPRPSTSFGSVAAPIGSAPGHSASFTSSSFSTVPTSRSLVASTTCAIAGPSFASVGRLIRTRYSTRLAPAATRNANVKTPTNLLFMWLPAPPAWIPPAPGAGHCFLRSACNCRQSSDCFVPGDAARGQILTDPGCTPADRDTRGSPERLNSPKCWPPTIESWWLSRCL